MCAWGQPTRRHPFNLLYLFLYTYYKLNILLLQSKLQIFTESQYTKRTTKTNGKYFNHNLFKLEKKIEGKENQISA